MGFELILIVFPVIAIMLGVFFARKLYLNLCNKKNTNAFIISIGSFLVFAFAIYLFLIMILDITNNLWGLAYYSR
jgi:hypothetical protein